MGAVDARADAGAVVSAPFVVHTTAGEVGTQHDSLEDAARFQVVLRGPIVQAGVVVAEAIV